LFYLRDASPQIHTGKEVDAEERILISWFAGRPIIFGKPATETY